MAVWVLLGLAAFAVLPWYFLQQQSLWAALPGVWGGDATASGLVQAAVHGRPWLWCGMGGLVLAGLNLLLTGAMLRIGGWMTRGPYLPETMAGLTKTTRALLGR